MSDFNPQGGPAPAAAPPRQERRVAAWIGRSVRIEGKIVSKEDLTIDGEVDGSVELKNHNLTVAPGGAINADLLAKTITISGAVTGEVTAIERVDIRATGSVTGNITAPRVVLTEGGFVAGRVETDRPSKG